MAIDSQVQAFINNDFVPFSEANLHISDLAIQRGFGVFDFIKVEGSKPLFLDKYLQRLYNSANELNLIAPYPKEELEKIIYQLIQKNSFTTSGLKIILTGGYSPSGYEPVKPNLIIQQQPLVLPDKQKLEEGISVITHNYVRELPTVKTINYSMGIKLLKELQEKGAEEVLYYNNGVATEFPRCNFFIVRRDGVVATPSRNILHGITRKNVLELACSKFEVLETDITLSDIMDAREAFLTSTTKRILPIVKVDRKQIGNGKPGDITRELLQDLIALEKKQLANTY
jgi:branched-chain amino acid aminotransferase